MKGRAIIYNTEELAWLKANCKLPVAEYAQGFNARFDRDITEVNLNALRKRKGWKTGRTGKFEKGLTPHNKGKPYPRRGRMAETQFKKGQEPHNTKFLGHERVSKDGYIEISVAQKNPHTGYGRRYVLKHRHLWEQKHGPVPKGHCLKCLDGNRRNTDPANWEAIPRGAGVHLVVGRHGNGFDYDAAPAELKPAILTLAKVKHARTRQAARAA